MPGKSHGQRSLAGYSPWGHKELDMTELLSTAQHSWLSALPVELPQSISLGANIGMAQKIFI